MSVNTLNFKSGITELPTYLDGYFDWYELIDNDGLYPEDRVRLKVKNFPFELLSFTDRIKFEADQRDIEITHKIRTSQNQEFTSMSLLKIADNWHKVYNTYHFFNKDGYAQSDITLIRYEGEVVIDD